MAQQHYQERKVPVARSSNSLIEQEFESIREKFEIEMHKMEEEMAKFRSQLIESEKNRLISSTSSSTSSSTTSRSVSEGQKAHSSKTKIQQQRESTRQRLNDAQISASQASKSLLSTSARSTVHSSREQATAGNDETRLCSEQMQSCNKNTSNQSRTNFGNVEQQQQHFSTANWFYDIDSPLIKDTSEGGKILKLRFDVEQYEPDQIVVKTDGNRLQVHARREDTTRNQHMFREYNREFLLPEGIDPELIKSTLSADGILTVEAPLSIERHSTV